MKFKYLITIIVCGSLCACSDFLQDVNSDPNKANDVPISAILPNVQVVLVDVTGGDFSRYNGLFVQHVEGVARAWSPFSSYNLTPNRFDAAWQNIYENALTELNVMQSKAIESNYHHYLGVTNVLKAYTLMMATDVWGDIPYTEAAKGTGNLNPSYDDQEIVIYPAIFDLLDEAILLFNGNAGNLVPGSEDLYYQGDINQWTKAAYALRARANLHWGNYDEALSDSRTSFSGPVDNLSFTYEVTNAAPWYRFNRDRTGDMNFHPTLASIMNSLNDTVRRAILEPSFELFNEHPYLVADFEQELISYREIKFIEAECLLRTSGSQTELSNAYLDGIEASFLELGLTVQDAEIYVNQALVNPGVGNITLDHIITQKYIGLFLQPEVWSDWRRTNIPTLVPTSGSFIPVRWHYSSDEYFFNSNSPDEGEITLFPPNFVDWDN